jgi:hypothetical protein
VEQPEPLHDVGAVEVDDVHHLLRLHGLQHGLVGGEAKEHAGVEEVALAWRSWAPREARAARGTVPITSRGRGQSGDDKVAWEGDGVGRGIIQISLFIRFK